MIDMNTIDKLYDFIRCKDWSAAHAMLDEIELVDPNTHGIAHWRSVVLHDEGRFEDALDYLAENLHRFNCKTSVFHKRASIFYEMGNNAAALKELAKAPFDSEIVDAGDGCEIFLSLRHGGGRVANFVRTMGGNSR